MLLSPLVHLSSAPATMKRGFSGFMGRDHSYTCNDASVLGLDKSWYYTWMPHPLSLIHI